MIRAFVAIPLPDGHADALERLQERLPLGRTVPPENFHVTLAFLDDQPEDVLEEVHHALADIAVPGAQVAIGPPATFGRKEPTTVIAEVAPDAALSRLRERVRGAARAAGLDLPRERFRPHVTLARIGRRPAPDDIARLRDWLQAQAGFSLPPVPVNEIVLYRSTLTRSGALHDPLERYAVA